MEIVPKMKKHRLVVFVGTVGAGKSTQIKLLAFQLRNKGLKVKTAYIRTNHLFAHLLSLILARGFIKNRKSPRRAHVRALIEEKPAIFRSIFKLWLALDLFGTSLRFLLTVFLPTRMGYTVLVEDYVSATIFDHIYFSRVLNLPYKASSFVPRFLSRLIHVAGSTRWVFLDANKDTLKSRLEKRGSFIEKTDYLQMQRNTVLFLSKTLSSYELLYVDTTDQNAMETCERVVGHLMEPR